MRGIAFVLLASLGLAAAAPDNTTNSTSGTPGQPTGQIVLVDAQHASAPNISQIMESVHLSGEHPSVKAVFNNSIFSGFTAELSAASIDILQTTPGVVGVVNNTAVTRVGGSTPEESNEAAQETAQSRRKRDVIFNRRSPWGLQRISQRNEVFPPNTSNAELGDPTKPEFTYTFNRTHNQGLIDIYILDMAINADHVAFGGRATRGWRYAQSPVQGMIPFLQNVHLPVSWARSDKQATAIAGVAGSDPYGVANSANIIGVQLGEHHADTAGLFAGISYVVDQHTSKRGDHIGSIVSLSMQWLDPTGLGYEWLLSRLNKAGIHIAVAAGDWSSEKCYWFPAQLGGSRSSVVTVGAVDHTDQKLGTSNSGSCVDVYAPGDTILSTGVTSTGDRNDGVTVCLGSSQVWHD